MYIYIYTYVYKTLSVLRAIAEQVHIFTSNLIVVTNTVLDKTYSPY
jgi:hypothetical protein